MTQRGKQGDSLPRSDGLCSVATSQPCIIKIQFKNEDKPSKFGFVVFRSHFQSIYSPKQLFCLCDQTPLKTTVTYPGASFLQDMQNGERGIDIYWHFLICRVLGKQLSRAECEALKGQVVAKQEQTPGRRRLTERCAVCSSVLFSA